MAKIKISKRIVFPKEEFQEKLEVIANKKDFLNLKDTDVHHLTNEVLSEKGYSKIPGEMYGGIIEKAIKQYYRFRSFHNSKPL